MKSFKLGLRIALSVVVSVILLALTFGNIDGAKVYQHVGKLSLPAVGLYLSSLVSLQFFRAWRWIALTQGFAKLNFRQGFRISNIGNMMIVLLPLRLGEVVRPVMMQREYQVPLAQSIGAVTVERLIDGLLVSVLFFMTTGWLSQQLHLPAGLQWGAMIALIVFASASVLLLAAWWQEQRLQWLLGQLLKPWLPGFHQKIATMLASFVGGIRGIPNFQSFLGVVALTLGYWLASAWGFMVLGNAFGFQLGFLPNCILVCVLVIGIMIPAGPGMLGTYQGALVTGLRLFGVNYDQSAAFALVAYPLNMLIVVGFALPYLFGKRKVHSSSLLAG